MKDIRTQFELLLKAGKLEEAKAMLAGFAAEQHPEGERLDALMLETRLSIKLTNAINASYLASLNEAVERLEALQAVERKLHESVKLAEARAALTK